MKENKYYLNLTNGLELLSNPNFNKEYKFVRIQSCTCERHLWNKLLLDLDYNFLMDIALGYNVIVYDSSPHKLLSRALYQGVEFINYTLNRVWLNKKIIPYVNNHNCEDYFEEEFKNLDKKVIKKLKYVKKFLNTDTINITCIGEMTKNDGNYEYFKNILINNLTR